MASGMSGSKIWKYKKQLDAFVKREEDDKVLTMLKKINKVDLTIEMIRETSIGKVVNSLLSRECRIGETASKLIEKWKRLIEERVDEKYRSDDKNESSDEPVECATDKKPTQISTKSETLKRTPLKRKSQDCSKPAKHPRTETVLQRLSDDESSEENAGQSFFAALNQKSSMDDDDNDSCEEIPVVNYNKLHQNKLNGMAEEEPRLADSQTNYNGVEYPLEVVELLEDICQALENKKKAQTAKQVNHDASAGRVHAVPSLFCGKKSNSSKNIPTFIEKFQNLLYDSIDTVEYIGDVPFEILEGVLRKLTPTQLERFECYNPTAVHKSDDIWKMHVLSKNSNTKPAEHGSWRDLYLDSRNAMTAKFEQCRQKFNTNVAKMKREEHKTKFFDPCVPLGGRGSSKVTLLNGSTGHSVSRNRGIPQKAPLMQKTLKMMKGHSRR